ncbi:MAG: formyltetrahydrofolate deformylase [Candidatus Marinimicrobia bacterium]|nr:formyltetrahydrofolate deformylase [Candidatus Neomarinimicrobiota bacterium]|tara:strand:- start:1144 stop:2013 length:870 start_codon:yes stop_codon:yes gene_type:complete
MIKQKLKKYIILFNCPDQQGIVAKITGWLFKQNLNIISMEEHVEDKDAEFFIRIVLISSIKLTENKNFISNLVKIEKMFNGQFSIKKFNKKENCAIFVTKEQLPLYDLLIKHQTNDLNCNVKMVVSNHNRLKLVADKFHIPYFYFPLNPQNKSEIEPQIIQSMKNNKIDIIVLARYMQILSPKFIKKYEQKIINIHHGFLPAFKGGRPYRQAWERGVKIIGATAHYVTNELDEGPIISQDVISINHTYSEKNMIRAGKDIERRVLTSAVQAHLDYRVIVHNGRTIVFNR